MKNTRSLFITLFILLLEVGLIAYAQHQTNNDQRYVSMVVDCKKQNLKFYWKNKQGEIYRSIQHLKQSLEKRKLKLAFAMNGGMYMQDHSPLGLYIEEGKQLSAINTKEGTGNFYMKPNGVFYVTADQQAFICLTEKFRVQKNIRYATQSGPMLLVDGVIHPSFKQGSANLNIRNGVGILPDHTVLFAMSKEAVNFYDFAEYFKQKGCLNALYLDGFVSRTYLPAANWIQTDGDFGVIIGVTSK